ncbi:MAG: hypothetical protein OEV78_03835 [Spirochaetia bacterium]|nr:hypothetical protein [Spirochaetia bacterium]
MSKKNTFISLLTFILIFLSSSVFTQTSNNQEGSSSKAPIKAVTESGESVNLYFDGTWKYVPKELRAINSKKFTTPSLSKDNVKGKNTQYTINYDSKKWKILEKSLSEIAEYSLEYTDAKAYAMVVPENEYIPMEELRNVVIQNVREASSSVKILNEEERVVNGVKVIMLTIKANIEGMNFIYMYYIYSEKKSSFQIVGFTAEESFPDYKNDIEELLNGFVVK